MNSQMQFNDGSVKGSFPYLRFYNSIVSYLEESMPANARAQLLAFWNAYVVIKL